MKAIINGMRYDTDTAEALGRYTNELGPGDFRHVDEQLYRTANGRFFLTGSGGAMTKYAEGNGQETWGSEKLIPIDDDSARHWLERNKHWDTIERLFPVEEA
jgi:hypothetical protein